MVNMGNDGDIAKSLDIGHWIIWGSIEEARIIESVERN
jgi:hypothetical protein